MTDKAPFLKRYWTLLAAFLIPSFVLCAERVGDDLFAARDVWIMCSIYAAVVALCLGLIIHSWQMQRRSARNGWRLVSWAHVLLFPVLSTIVLGLRKIQVSTYDLAIEREQFQKLHWISGDVKDHLIWAVPLDMVLIVLWGTVAVFKNKSGRPDSRPA